MIKRLQLKSTLRSPSKSLDEKLSGISDESVNISNLIIRFLERIDFSELDEGACIDVSRENDYISFKLNSKKSNTLSFTLDIFDGFLEVFMGEGIEVLLAYKFKNRNALIDFLEDCLCSRILRISYRDSEGVVVKENFKFYRDEKVVVNISFRNKWTLFKKLVKSEKWYVPWVKSCNN